MCQWKCRIKKCKLVENIKLFVDFTNIKWNQQFLLRMQVPNKQGHLESGCPHVYWYARGRLLRLPIGQYGSPSNFPLGKLIPYPDTQAAFGLDIMCSFQGNQESSCIKHLKITASDPGTELKANKKRKSTENTFPTT